VSLIITSDCINCNACFIECPVEAVHKPSDEPLTEYERKELYMSVEHYYIDSNKCDECNLFNAPRCVVICPMDSIKTIDQIKKIGKQNVI